jgi:hypothetical protein
MTDTTDRQEPAAAGQLHGGRIRIAFWIGALCVAIARAWWTRYSLEPDSISYFDLGDALLRRNWTMALNSYWAPYYGFLAAAVLHLTHASPLWKAPVVHLVNILVFAFALAAFEYLWKGVIAEKRRARDYTLPEWTLWVFGYFFFITASLDIITIGLATPDLLASAFVYLAAGIILRIYATESPSSWHYLALGLVLGLGYLVKAPFFVMAAVFIASAAWDPSRRRPTWKAWLAVLAFLLVAAPWAVSLSLKVGRPTFSDAARLNWAWYVNGVTTWRYWQGDPVNGKPFHPMRKIYEHPIVFEYANSSPVTYLPWYDPAYWHEGVSPHFDVRRFASVFMRQVVIIVKIACDTSAVFLTIGFMLVLITVYQQQYERVFGFWVRYWFVWLPAAFALFMFSCVHVEARFLGGHLVLLWAGLLLTVRFESEHSRILLRAVTIAAALSVGIIFLTATLEDAAGIVNARGRSAEHGLAAVALLNAGLHPGSPVACIGNGTSAFWAWMGGFHVIAEIPDSIPLTENHPALDFWTISAGQQTRVLNLLAQTGAKAVVAESVPGIVPPGWTRLGNTGHYVYWFH